MFLVVVKIFLFFLFFGSLYFFFFLKGGSLNLKLSFSISITLLVCKGNTGK